MLLMSLHENWNKMKSCVIVSTQLKDVDIITLVLHHLHDTVTLVPVLLILIATPHLLHASCFFLFALWYSMAFIISGKHKHTTFVLTLFGNNVISNKHNGIKTYDFTSYFSWVLLLANRLTKYLQDRALTFCILTAMIDFAITGNFFMNMQTKKIHKDSLCIFWVCTFMKR